MFTENFNSDLEVLIGSLDQSFPPTKISFFDSLTIDFLSELSEDLMVDEFTKNYGDVFSFAFWIRRSNLEMVATNYLNETNRTGYGTCFHITPSNVPINFAYSLVVSLLSGNRNIVRIPSKHYPQVDFLILKIGSLLEKSKYKFIYDSVCIVRYEKNEKITHYLISRSDMKIVWGGDTTISSIRNIQAPPHCKEIVFSDRKSIAIFSESYISSLSDTELFQAVNRFYIDSYLFDQNACSSPRIVFWLTSEEIFPESKNRFWGALQKVVNSRYEIEPRNLILKFTELALYAAGSDKNTQIGDPGQKLTVIDSDFETKQLGGQLNCRFGSFFQQNIDTLEKLSLNLDQSIQTVSYLGVDPNAILEAVQSFHIRGVDRIVPVGMALNFDFTWDGYDLPRALSRLISVK